MRRALATVIVLAFLAGCLGPTGTRTSGSASPTSAARAVADNSTLDGKLSHSPHVKIGNGMTLEWDFPNASKERPATHATLVQLLDTYKSSHHAFDGNFHAVAFIPVGTRDAVAACGPQDKPIKSFLRHRDAGNNNRFGSLTGTYEKGWYHAVLVAFEPASFTLSFDAAKEARPRALPAADPHASVGAAHVAGGREVAHTIPAGEGIWLGWANAQVSSNSFDGGRTHKIELGCQTHTLTREAGQSGFNQNNVVTVSGNGPEGAVEVKATYAPTISATALTTTVMEVGWVRLAPIPLAEPVSTGASKAP